MEIFVKTVDKDCGIVAWYNHHDSNGESYLYDSKDLETTAYGEYILAGTPFKSVVAAKKAGKEAKKLASWDGYDVVVSYWRYKSGKLVETKFTRDNKIKH